MGCCGHGDELSDPSRSDEFLHLLRQLFASEEGIFMSIKFSLNREGEV